ncbi:hypothetical protein D3C76_1682490 [compost metagenome]
MVKLTISYHTPLWERSLYTGNTAKHCFIYASILLICECFERLTIEIKNPLPPVAERSSGMSIPSQAAGYPRIDPDSHLASL